MVLCVILVMSCLLGLTACASGEPGSKPTEDNKPGTTAAVTKVEVSKEPDKTEYYVGEAFSAAGGMITVHYEDNTTAEVPMTDSGVELTEPNMDKAGNKTITVSYGGKRARFSVSVQNQGFKVTFDMNFEGGENVTANVVKGTKVEKPADPERAGYAFYNWYQDQDCTVLYDFEAPVTADTTVYAAWKQDGVTYYEVTYDLNYYGVTPQTFTQIVASGDTAKSLQGEFVRADYTFNGWFVDAAGENAYTGAPITADTVIYAGWTKTKTGTTVYTFEAEHTDMTGKTGPGFSGTASEGDMIIDNATASGGKAISYLYKKGLTLDFYIASDVAVDDATITLSLAAEMDNISFTAEEFQIVVNGTVLDYSAMSLVNDSTFQDAITITGVSLNEGANSIVLAVNNSKRPMGDASTYAATAPMVDCIKIETSAVLIWDANHGLPAQY